MRGTLFWIAVLSAGCGTGMAPGMAMESAGGAEAATGGEEMVAEAEPAPPAGIAAGPQVSTGAGASLSGDAPGTRPNPTMTANPLTAVVVRRGGAGDDSAEARVARARSSAPLLIYTADLHMRVDPEDVTPTIEHIVEAAVQLGGYLAGRDDHSVQVRIPSVSFREGLAEVEQLGEITHRAVSAEDVSAEYHDLDVRLTNLRALRERLEGLLARASNIEEILRVESELERISREIDTKEGRLRYLRSRVAFSLVSVRVEARPVVIVEVEEAVEVAAPPPPPPPRLLDLPVEWFERMGLERLLDL